MKASIVVVSIVFAALATACSVQVPERATGEEIYLQLCSRCHGGEMEGRIAPPLGPGSPSASQTDEYLGFTIEHGRGRMPSFGSTLDDAQVDALVAYIRAVQAA